MKVLLKLALGAMALAASLTASAADPTTTSYSLAECEGSLTPYPTEFAPATFPDSLVPVFINHVGRHGARYPASSANCLALRRLLQRADSAGTITPLGRRLAALNDRVIALSNNRWGALDSVGIAEQQGIASRMYINYAEAFGSDGTVRAISSYSPRSMMSMYAFTHQLDRLNNKLTFHTSTGRINSALMRPFDINAAYLEFRRDKTWEPAYREYFDTRCPVTAIRRAVGNAFPFTDENEARNAALTEYYVLAGLSAMGLEPQMADYFTVEEANALWSCFNLRQYLQRTASTITTIPADIAADLVLDLIETTDNFVMGNDTATKAWLRFGHAETLMPLLSLLHIPGCYYLTNYFDTVAANWRDFDVVPMAANFQMIVFKARGTDRYYVRVDVNEQPVKMRRGDDSIYFPWGELRRYMMNCVPLQ